MSPEALELRGHTEQLRQELTDLKQRLDGVASEGIQRNQALIAARAEVGRLQEEVQRLHAELQQWRADMSNISDNFHVRNEQRLTEMRDLAATIEALNQRYQQALAGWEIPPESHGR